MAFQPYNLIDGHFQGSNLFHHLPVFDEIYYQGLVAEKVQSYRALREGQECQVRAVTIVRKDEDIIWTASKDLLERSVKDAAQVVQGIYTFDLLTFDLHRTSQAFDGHELSRLIMNHALKLRAGEQRLIKYLHAFGLLQKLVDEPWGKITFKTAVEVFNDKPTFLFALIKRLLGSSDFSRHPVIILVNDLSMTPVYDPADERQQTLLKKLMDDQAVHSVDFIPEVYVQNRNGAWELFSRTTVAVSES